MKPSFTIFAQVLHQELVTWTRLMLEITSSFRKRRANERRSLEQTNQWLAPSFQWKLNKHRCVRERMRDKDISDDCAKWTRSSWLLNQNDANAKRACALRINDPSDSSHTHTDTTTSSSLYSFYRTVRAQNSRAATCLFGEKSPRSRKEEHLQFFGHDASGRPNRCTFRQDTTMPQAWKV
ncbi:hypothetical protein JHK86_004357 [Glycine max]|nr:hypothetical protein JHK86_004357 [Glycine max]